MQDTKLPTTFALIPSAIFAAQAAISEVSAAANHAFKDALAIGTTSAVHAAHAELSWEIGVQAAIAATTSAPDTAPVLVAFETPYDAEPTQVAQLD